MKDINDLNQIIKTSKHYPTPTDLIYRYEFTYEELEKIDHQKKTDDNYVKLPLLNEDDIPLVFYENLSLKDIFKDAENILNGLHNFRFVDFNDEEFIENFTYSEIEGNLGIEGFKCNRNDIEKINRMNYDDLTTNQDVVVKNMLLSYEFIMKNEITEKNIRILYDILSNNCLKLTEQLLPDNLYRDNEKEIADRDGMIVDKGVNHLKLKKLMKSLIAFIKDKGTLEDEFLKPHIIHYYILYLHPYFALNGRMARLLSHWYSIKYLPKFSFAYTNEAINNKHNRHQYFNAIVTSRQTNNDITYFLEYIARITIDYALIYKNTEIITSYLEGKGYVLSNSVVNTLKNILTMPKDADGFFTWKRYASFSNDGYSKVLYLKHLNQLAEYKVLVRKKDKNAYMYRLNTKRFDLY